MATDEFLEPYFAQYQELMYNEDVRDNIHKFADLARTVRDNKGKMMFSGNGASASVAEHGAVDFTKQGGVRGVTFHDPNLMTCFANDFGFDQWVAQAIEHYADANDAVVLISVSGQSPSVVNAAKHAKSKGLKVVSFTGRSADNPLKMASDIAFWAPSDAYNVVENLHGMWLTATIDLVIGSSVYETRAYEL